MRARLTLPSANDDVSHLSTRVRVPSAMAAVKVCVVGPAGAGKTALCKLLAGRAVPEPRTHDPTESVRIEEIERDIDARTVSVQLWDCSGDLARCQSSLPALRLGLDALVLVRDAEDPGGDGALERWHETFANGPDTRCLVVRIGKSASAARDDAPSALTAPPTIAQLAGARVVRGSLHDEAAVEALVAETREALDGVLAEATRDRRGR